MKGCGLGCFQHTPTNRRFLHESKQSCGRSFIVVGVVYKPTPTKSATVVGVNKSYGCYIAKLCVYVRRKYLSYYMNAMLV